jgi:hypothetical protein
LTRRYLVLGLWIATVDAWFQGPVVGRVAGPLAAVPLGVALVAAVLWARAGQPRSPATGGDRRFMLAVAGVALLATLVRLPALAAPASLISSDSAVAGIIAQEIAGGQRPAPIYAPGFPYEGTLKPHLTAALAAILPGGIPSTYAWASHLFYLLWLAAVMALAREAGGLQAAVAAGAFMAVSPRFLLAFSLNNVGQYPEVNALGALALFALSGHGAVMAAAFLVGLALWQQLVAVYFVVTIAVLVALTPEWRRPRRLVDAGVAFFAGSYPIWIWNAANGWATFDLFRRGAKVPADRITGIPDRLERTLAVSFPKLFGLTDLGAGPALALVLGALLPALILVMAFAKRREIAERRGRSAALVGLVLFVAVVSVFAASKFSHRGASRPRYLLPVYTSAAIAFGWGIAALARRSRPGAVVVAAAVLGANLTGVIPWLQGRAEAEARDRALLAELERLHVRTAYAGFWVAPKYTFLGEGRVTLSGELGPIVSWVYPPHAAIVREAGPDAYVVDDGPLAEAFEARLNELACPHHRTNVAGFAIFHGLARKVSLEDVAGYDLPATIGKSPEEDDDETPPGVS